MPEHQQPAGGAQLQRSSVHSVPLADRALGPVHRRLLHPSHQRLCRAGQGRRQLLLHRHADQKGHLCEGQRGTGAAQKVSVQGFKSCDLSLRCERCSFRSVVPF